MPGHGPGDDLLSQDLSSHYHRRWGVSLPGSEWDRVVPPRCGHQRGGSSLLVEPRTLGIKAMGLVVPGWVAGGLVPLSGIHMEETCQRLHSGKSPDFMDTCGLLDFRIPKTGIKPNG